jgi:hypothetical protein
MYGAMEKILLEHSILISNLLVWRTCSCLTMEINPGLLKAERNLLNHQKIPVRRLSY